MSYLDKPGLARHLLLGAAGLLLPHAAFAQSEQECDVDADCEPGFACEVTSAGGSCSGGCDDEGNCSEPVCETFEFRSCVPGPCTDDSDCSEGMVCHTETYGSCTDPAWICDDGEDGGCRPSAPPSCEEFTRSQCTPRHALPCTADADCGEGFRCVEQLWLECEDFARDDVGSDAFEPGSGTSAPTPVVGPAGPAAAPPELVPGPGQEPEWEDEAWTPPVCEQVPSGYFSCELVALPCDSDADCPSTMACQDNYPLCAVGGSTTDAANTTGAPVDMPPADSDGEAPLPLPGTPQANGGGSVEPVKVECGIPEGLPPKVCRPRYYGGSGWFGPVDLDSASGMPGTTAPDPADNDGDGSSENNTSAPPGAGTGGGDANPNGGPGANMGGGESNSGDTEEPQADDEGRPRNPSDWWRGPGRRHGCSVGEAAQPSDALSLLLGVGLALSLRRRKR